MPRIDEREERSPAGVSCGRTRQGLVVTVGGGHLTVGGGQLRVVWEPTWGDRRDRRVACSDVADVAVVPDQRAVAGHPTWRLEVGLKDGQVLVPVRRARKVSVYWVAARLRRELGLPALEPLPKSEWDPDAEPAPHGRKVVRRQREVVKVEPPPRPVGGIL